MTGTLLLNFPKRLGRHYSNLGVDSTPTLESLTLGGLTASQLLQTDASKQLTSVSDLTNWIAGTDKQVNVVDDGDGTLTLSTLHYPR